MKSRYLISCLAATGILVAPGLVAPAQSADFYAGKTVSLYIGNDSGSAYDQYGRLFARNIDRFVPGKPTMVARNMPGAGGMRAMNFMYQAAPRDGLVWATVDRGIAAEPLLYGDAAKTAFKDPLEFNWIGSLNTEIGVFAVWHTTGIKSWDEVQKKQVIVAIASANGGVSSRVVNNLLNANFRQVCCYGGGNNQNLAMERGEVEGRVGWSWSSLKASSMDWLKDGKIRILMQLGLQKNSEIPGDVPLVLDLAKSEKDKKALEIIFSRQSMGRPFFLPPGVSADRVAVVRTAFDAMVKDKAFLADAEKFHLEINDPKSGKDIEVILKNIYASPPDAVAAARSALASGEVKMVREAKKKKKKKKAE